MALPPAGVEMRDVEGVGSLPVDTIPDVAVTVIPLTASLASRIAIHVPDILQEMGGTDLTSNLRVRSPST